MTYQSYIAAHRFGLGAGGGDMRGISQNPKGWLKAQIKSGTQTALAGSFKTTDEITRQVSKIKAAKQAERRKIIKQGVALYSDEMEARFQHAIKTETPLIERLVMFWSNHFAVSFKGKPYIAGLMGAYERDAIRPHVLGKFSDMLRAVVEHPAMLVYLDNVQSFGPNSVAGKRRNRGLNENLAREILELHTLGVDGGYTQKDVIEFAKILTGWTIKPPRQGGGGFEFIKYIHEPGEHVLLGKKYNQSNQAQGIAALNDLARHPSTARFIATKMARHFISDNPSKTSIRKLERTFINSDGDLRSMVDTLINMPEVWKNPLPKIKKPYEMVVSCFRLMDIPDNKIPFKRVAQSLALLDHLPFQAPSPKGWPDTTDDWLSPNAMMNRVEWCHAFAQIIRPKENPLDFARGAFGSVVSADTLTWIERAPSPVDGLALMLASPEWQRR